MTPTTRLLAFASILPIVATSIVCNSPTQTQINPVALDRNIVADVFGNHDGVTSADELQALENYFADNIEAWCISGLGQESWTTSVVTPDQVRKSFASISSQPYPSEPALRQACGGLNIRTPFVSIAVLQRGDQILLTRFYRSPGTRISSAEWQRLPIQ
jgi:hypothetical protein